ncbi:MAG: SPFH domain-containing protein, partial [Candidatus Eremiobacterota bacterium]
MEFLLLQLLVLFWLGRRLGVHNLVPRRQVVRWHERGLLVRRGVVVRVLPPGTWTVIPWFHEVVVTEVRPKVVQWKGQEVMTSDPLSIRLNLAGTCEIFDLERWTAAGEKPEDILYVQVQMALRELISSCQAEALLSDRNTLSSVLLERVQPGAESVGARWTLLGIK